MDCNTPTVLSLCTGAGGLDLGLKLAVPGCKAVCYVEGEAYAASILAARMEDETLDAAPVWSDVKSFDAARWRGCVDIITAGYPCQPFSIAGKKKAEADPRHLWPYIRDIVDVIRPRICFFENVSHHLRLGFEQVHDDLSAMGYCVAAGLFTAEEIGATHKRERLFILADRDGNRCECEQGAPAGENDPQGWAQCPAHAIAGRDRDAAGWFSVHEAGSGKAKIRQGLQGSENPVADTARAGAWINQPHTRKRPRGNSAAMADPQSSRERREAGDIPEANERPYRECTQLSGGSGQSLANTLCTGLERYCWYEAACEPADLAAVSGFPVWPPAPGDHEQWGYVADALKPSIHRMADGMANRVDRLRLCGNGVVPLVAAYAFQILYGSLRS